MKRLILALALALPLTVPATPILAYSYSATGEEPLLKGREALFSALAKGDWTAAEAAMKVMSPDLDYLDKFEDKGIAKQFADAMAARDAEAVRAAFTRAAADEIVRRMDGARQNLDDYQVAKVLVITANRFFAAIRADLAPRTATLVNAELTRAAEAIGNPGVFGVGQKAPDPQDFDESKNAIAGALAKVRGKAE